MKQVVSQFADQGMPPQKSAQKADYAVKVLFMTGKNSRLFIPDVCEFCIQIRKAQPQMIFQYSIALSRCS